MVKPTSNLVTKISFSS